MARTPLVPTLLLLSACVTAPAEDVTRASDAADAMAGACHAETVIPAELETVTEQVLDVPPMTTPDGTVLRPARYRSATSTRVVSPREVTRFETPCALARRDPEFIMQIQRALQVRGLYDGPVSGSYDREIRAAVRAFQADLHPESGELSTEAAQRLGLVALGRHG